MTTDEVISAIDYLYSEYDVSKEFYLDLSIDKRLKCMKGILAELDQKKKIEYKAEDIELIKEIYFMYC